MRILSLTALIFGSVATLAAAPTIGGVVNAAAWLPPAVTNSGIAQGAMFTVIGSDLGPAGFLQVQDYPLPTTQGLGGTTIQVKVGAVTETCIMIYTVATQVAAVLPSATPTGAGTLTVTYQGESASIAIQVVEANVGTFTLNEGGTGPGIFTDAITFKPITMINPAHPGEALTLWATGLGAVTGDEAAKPPTPVDLKTGVQVLIESQPAKVLYGGRSNYTALDQINFEVPDGISGCKISVVVVVKGITGNVTTISIAPAGQTTCGDSFNALTSANLQKAVSSGSLAIAGVALNHVEGQDDKLIADFASFPLNSLIRSYGGTASPSIGNCLAYETYAATLSVVDPIQGTFLDSGAQLMITGPNGAKTVDATSKGVYTATLATAAPFFISPGNYTATNGPGGANVGSFTWDLTLPSPVVPTNIPASIDRSQDLKLTWTGGSNYPAVSIFGYSAVPVTSTLFSWVEFLCTADGSAGEFTVPSAILSLLPTNGYGSKGVLGVNIQIGGIAGNHFSGAAAPGLDEGFLTAFTSSGSVAKVQ